jgi:hypothetical protein
VSSAAGEPRPLRSHGPQKRLKSGDLVLDANSNGDESFVHVLAISYATTDANAVFEDLTP